MRTPEKLLMLIDYCKSDVTNSNDYVISSEIIKRLVQQEDLAIEKISLECNISQASISRFIRKAGFNSWQNFKECCNGACPEMAHRRYLFYKAPEESKNSTKDWIYRKIISNIEATYNVFSQEKINLVFSLINDSTEIVFLGDEHSLSTFYTFQLDLIFSGKISYLYMNNNLQDAISTRCKVGTLVIFLNVENNFITTQRKEFLETAHKNGSKILVFSQQDCSKLIPYDYCINYGLANSVNDGYYSLFFISQVLSDALIGKTLSKNESEFQ